MYIFQKNKYKKQFKEWVIIRTKIIWETKLSLSGLKEMMERYSAISEKIPDVAVNAVRTLSEEGIKDNYRSVVIDNVKTEGTRAIGGFQTTNPNETFAEYGTGLIGSQSPNVAEAVKKAGWKYDVNNHGEKGWVYYKEVGDHKGFHWTKGQKAQKKFYNATVRVEEKSQEVLKNEFEKMLRELK